MQGAMRCKSSTPQPYSPSRARDRAEPPPASRTALFHCIPVFQGKSRPMAIGTWRIAKCFKPLVPSETSCSPACSGSWAAPWAALLQHWLSVLGAAPGMSLCPGSQELLLLLPVLLQERQTLTPAVPTWTRTGPPPPGLQPCLHHIYLEVALEGRMFAVEHSRCP